MEELKAKVIRIIAEHLGLDESKIKLGSYYIEDLGADSLDLVELVMAMEEEFGIEIPDEDAENLFTVNDSIAYLQSNLSSQNLENNFKGYSESMLIKDKATMTTNAALNVSSNPNVTSICDLDKKVIRIIAEHLCIEESKIALSSDFVEDLGVDSLDAVELVMAMEEEFEIEITEDAAEKITKVGEAVAYLKNRGY